MLWHPQGKSSSFGTKRHIAPYWKSKRNLGKENIIIWVGRRPGFWGSYPDPYREQKGIPRLLFNMHDMLALLSTSPSTPCLCPLFFPPVATCPYWGWELELSYFGVTLCLAQWRLGSLDTPIETLKWPWIVRALPQLTKMSLFTHIHFFKKFLMLELLAPPARIQT